MFLEQIKKGHEKRPILALIYGVDGVGKTTFASQAPKPIFIEPEDGSAQIPEEIRIRVPHGIDRFPPPKTFSEAVNQVRELASGRHDYETLIVDTIDWLQDLAAAEVCKESGAKSIAQAAGGYGNGYKVLYEKMLEFKNELVSLRNIKKMNILILSHSIITEFNDPATETPYARYEVGLYEGKNGQNSVRALYRQFVDLVLFANFETFSSGKGKEARGIGEGKRKMYTSRMPAYDAKNRFSLPASLDFYWDVLTDAIKGAQPESAEVIFSQIDGLLSKMTDQDLASKVKASAVGAKTDPVKLNQILARLEKMGVA